MLGKEPANPVQALGQPRELIGIGLMVFAMLVIPIVDGLAKFLSSTHSPLYISWARYVMASLIVLPMAFFKFGRQVLPTTNLATHFYRTLFLVIAMSLYFVAISKTQMAIALTAYFISPIIAAGLAVIFLKERLTIQKLSALVLGFIGALIILQPGEKVEAGVLYAMASGAFFALYLIATRQAARQNDPIKTLVFQCVVGTVLLTPQALWYWSVPQLSELWVFAGIGFFSVLSHLCSIKAFYHAEASLLAPLIYLELIATAVIGYWFFHEVPAINVWLGAGVIVASGLLLIPRVRQR